MNKLWKLSHNLYSKIGGGTVARILEVIEQVIYSDGISAKASIGNGTVFFHHGLGCIVHEKAVIGDNCKIFGNVTIGSKWPDGKNTGGLPTIGNDVLIGAGAVILGEITIGDNSIIGANSVVTKDVPSNSIVVGVNSIKRRI